MMSSKPHLKLDINTVFEPIVQPQEMTRNTISPNYTICSNSFQSEQFSTLSTMNNCNNYNNYNNIYSFNNYNNYNNYNYCNNYNNNYYNNYNYNLSFSNTNSPVHLNDSPQDSSDHLDPFIETYNDANIKEQNEKEMKDTKLEPLQSSSFFQSKMIIKNSM